MLTLWGRLILKTGVKFRLKSCELAGLVWIPLDLVTLQGFLSHYVVTLILHLEIVIG